MTNLYATVRWQSLIERDQNGLCELCGSNLWIAGPDHDRLLLTILGRWFDDGAFSLVAAHEHCADNSPLVNNAGRRQLPPNLYELPVWNCVAASKPKVHMFVLPKGEYTYTRKYAVAVDGSTIWEMSDLKSAKQAILALEAYLRLQAKTQSTEHRATSPGDIDASPKGDISVTNDESRMYHVIGNTISGQYEILPDDDDGVLCALCKAPIHGGTLVGALITPDNSRRSFHASHTSEDDSETP